MNSRRRRQMLICPSRRPWGRYRGNIARPKPAVPGPGARPEPGAAGKGDWDVLSGPKLPASVRRPPGDVVNSEPFTNWISGGGTIEPLLLDKDVFGDSTVIMLNTPGHTPGHHVLLVKLPRTGNVLLSGDLAHFRENYDNNVVTGFNSSRAETLASFDRVKQIAANLKATVIIQHDPRDVDKLPAFPASAY